MIDALLNQVMRPDLRDVAAYSSARSESAGSAAISIDANEFPWPPAGGWGAACTANRYPEGQPAALIARMAALYDVGTDQVLLGRGSDEGIDLLLRFSCRAGVDNIVVCPPTFSMYEVYAKVQGAAVREAPLDAARRYALDVPRVLAACDANTKLIFIPTPNAPMGHKMDRASLLELCRARQGQSLVIADEAYVEFSDDPRGHVPDLRDYPNLVVLRTLSKAYALAGERVGAVVAHPQLIAALRRVQSPYPIPQSCIRVALDALSPQGLLDLESRRRVVVAERKRMAALLPQSSFIRQVFLSEGNFLLVVADDGAALMKRFAAYGIRPRSRESDMPNAVRISIGTPEENNAVLAALGLEVPATQKTASPRVRTETRVTKETKIAVTVDLDAPAFCQAATGIGFFDHMLAQIAQHGGFGLSLSCEGDLHTDQHHSIEDCALALGAAILHALGDKRGIGRYGFTLPLDEALAHVTLDLSGRAFAAFDGRFDVDKVGDMDLDMVPHFFRSFATALEAAIHVQVKGENAHHMVEACFKALGRALRQAIQREEGTQSIPSTKGVL